MLGQIEPLDKDVNHANRIVLANPVFQAFRKQRALPAIRALNEAPHPILPRIISRESHKRGVFTQPGSNSTELAETTHPFHVRSTPDTDHKFNLSVPVAVCRFCCRSLL